MQGLLSCLDSLYASELEQLGYMVRLGIWGAGKLPDTNEPVFNHLLLVFFLSHRCFETVFSSITKGTPFKDAKDFTTKVGSRGVGAMELVAMDLKARGMLLARSLSYRGADFEIEYPNLSGEFITM